MAALLASLEAAAPDLAALPAGRLLAAWQGAVAAFRDPASEERRRLDPALARATRLSPPGLSAGLEAVLGGVAGEHAAAVFAAARPPGAGGRLPPALVVLAGNLPALAVQPLLPALAMRRPVVLKSSRAEPLCAPAFLAALAAREPVLGEATAGLTWPGGEAALEAPLLARCDPVLAYGEAETVADLARRATGRLVAYGPRTSVALVGPGAEAAAVAKGIARDVALFDQRGCLSVAAVYTVLEPAELARALAAALAERGRRWPPGPATVGEAAAVRQVRDEAVMAGCRLEPLDPAAGTVVTDPRPTFRPTPGRRTVRVHPVAALGRAVEALAPWRGRLQGAALAGMTEDEEGRLRRALADLGVSRFTAPGLLQSPDARWQNGGVDPLEVLGV
jgi:hypothetical protein